MFRNYSGKATKLGEQQVLRDSKKNKLKSKK